MKKRLKNVILLFVCLFSSFSLFGSHIAIEDLPKLFQYLSYSGLGTSWISVNPRSEVGNVLSLSEEDGTKTFSPSILAFCVLEKCYDRISSITSIKKDILKKTEQELRALRARVDDAITKRDTKKTKLENKSMKLDINYDEVMGNQLEYEEKKQWYEHRIDRCKTAKKTYLDCLFLMDHSLDKLRNIPLKKTGCFDKDDCCIIL